MKIITWKTKLIIAAIIIALVLAGCGIVSAMDFGSLLLAGQLVLDADGMQNIYIIHTL